MFSWNYFYNVCTFFVAKTVCAFMLKDSLTNMFCNRFNMLAVVRYGLEVPGGFILFSLARHHKGYEYKYYVVSYPGVGHIQEKCNQILWCWTQGEENYNYWLITRRLCEKIYIFIYMICRSHFYLSGFILLMKPQLNCSSAAGLWWWTNSLCFFSTYHYINHTH